MKNLPQELVFILLLAAIMVYQLVMRHRRQQRREEPAPTAPPASEPDVDDTFWGRSPATAHAPPEDATTVPTYPRETPPHERRAPAAAASARGRASIAKRLFTGRKSLRDAIVVMAVLGPCRAQDPPRAVDK